MTDLVTPVTRPYAERLATPAPGVKVASGLVLVLAALVGASAVLSPLVPVALAAGAIAVAAAWQRPVVAAVLVVAVVPALSGVQRGLGLGSLKVSELLLVLSVAVLAVRRPLSSQRMRPADCGMVAFAIAGAGFAGVHVLTSASPPTSFVRIGLQPTLMFLTWWTASRSVRDARDLRRVLRWLLVVSTLPATLAVLQAFDIPGVRSLLIRLTGGPSLARPGQGGVARVTGPFPIWHSLAAYLLPVIVVGAVLLLRGDKGVLRRRSLVAVLAVDVAALVLTVTVTVVVWAAVAVLVAAALQRLLARALMLLLIAGVASAVVFAGPIVQRVDAQTATASPTTSSVLPQTMAYRVEVWRRDYVPLLERAVPYGVGNELPESVLFQHAENQYITLALRGGILLLVSAIAAMVLLGNSLARSARRDDLVGGAACALLTVLVFLPVAAMVWPYLTNAGFPQAWLSLAGAVTGATAVARVRTSPR